MTKDEAKTRAFLEIERHAGLIISAADSIFREPERGFEEVETKRKITEILKKLQLDYEEGIAITGVIASIGSKPLPKIGLLAEMDALYKPDHPQSSKTGYAHACGHSAQVAVLIGAAIGLSAIRESLEGSVKLCFVPAEEFIDISFRESLKKSGKIRYFGGKQEFMRLGQFDDVDCLIMSHAHTEDTPFLFPEGGTGFVSKSFTFRGRPAHAAAEPYKGINAFSCFHVFVTSLNALRETFKEEDMIRVNLSLTKCGEAVSVIPGEVKGEMYVRGKSLQAILETNKKVDRALKGAALSIGATVEVNNLPGYLPLQNNPELIDIAYENASRFGKCEKRGYFAASSDLGDLSLMLPCIEFSNGGFSGTLHGSDLAVSDPQLAYLETAKVYVSTCLDLLWNNAEKLLSIKRSFQQKLTKEEYFRTLDSLNYSFTFGEERCE